MELSVEFRCFGVHRSAARGCEAVQAVYYSISGVVSELGVISVPMPDQVPLLKVMSLVLVREISYVK